MIKYQDHTSEIQEMVEHHRSVSLPPQVVGDQEMLQNSEPIPTVNPLSLPCPDFSSLLFPLNGENSFPHLK